MSAWRWLRAVAPAGLVGIALLLAPQAGVAAAGHAAPRPVQQAAPASAAPPAGPRRESPYLRYARANAEAAGTAKRKPVLVKPSRRTGPAGAHGGGRR